MLNATEWWSVRVHFMFSFHFHRTRRFCFCCKCFFCTLALALFRYVPIQCFQTAKQILEKKTFSIKLLTSTCVSKEKNSIQYLKCIDIPLLSHHFHWAKRKKNVHSTRVREKKNRFRQAIVVEECFATKWNWISREKFSFSAIFLFHLNAFFYITFWKIGACTLQFNQPASQPKWYDSKHIVRRWMEKNEIAKILPTQNRNTWTSATFRQPFGSIEM